MPKRCPAGKKAVGNKCVVRPQTDYQKIWEAGRKISGGWGFWGEVRRLEDRKEKQMYLKAWVDGLTELGYSDEDIVFYGDWRDGRHIADSMSFQSDYEGMKRKVKENAELPKTVSRMNRKDYNESRWNAVVDIIE